MALILGLSVMIPLPALYCGSVVAITRLGREVFEAQPIHEDYFVGAAATLGGSILAVMFFLAAQAIGRAIAGVS